MGQYMHETKKHKKLIRHYFRDLHQITFFLICVMIISMLTIGFVNPTVNWIGFCFIFLFFIGIILALTVSKFRFEYLVRKDLSKSKIVKRRIEIASIVSDRKYNFYGRSGTGGIGDHKMKIVDTDGVQYRFSIPEKVIRSLYPLRNRNVTADIIYLEKSGFLLSIKLYQPKISNKASSRVKQPETKRFEQNKKVLEGLFNI